MVLERDLLDGRPDVKHGLGDRVLDSLVRTGFVLYAASATTMGAVTIFLREAPVSVEFGETLLTGRNCRARLRLWWHYHLDSDRAADCRPGNRTH